MIFHESGLLKCPIYFPIAHVILTLLMAFTTRVLISEIYVSWCTSAHLRDAQPTGSASAYLGRTVVGRVTTEPVVYFFQVKESSC